MARTRAAAPPADPPSRPRRQSGLQVANARVRDRQIPSIMGDGSMSTTAAASPQGRPNSVTPSRGPAHIWQEQAWSFYDSLGVVKYAGLFYGKSLSRIQLVPGIMGSDGRPQAAYGDQGEPVDGAELAEEVLALLRDLRAPLGGQPAMLRSFGINLFVAGECNLLGSEARPGDAASEQWEVLSIDELRAQGDGHERFTRFGGPGGQPNATYIVKPDLAPRKDEQTAFVCRIWQPHERFKRLADSSLRGVMDVCEELVLLTREVRGEALSRIPNGILGVSDEISYSGNSNPQDGTTLDPMGDIPPGDEEEDEFTLDLMEAMMTAIRDKGSAAAMVPIVVRGSTEAIDKGLKHIQLSRPESNRAILKRREAIEMFAMGVDLPVEVVLGHQQTTFANAFQIDEDTYKVHILPMMQVVADGLTTGYLWPKMAAARGLDPDEPLPDEITQNVVFWDPTLLVSHPDRSKEATEGHKLYVLSDSAWRRANGFNETDAPDDEEIGRRINIERLRNVRETERINIQEPGVPVESLTPADITKALSAAGAPTQPPDLLAYRIAAAADVTIDRAIDRFGARMRNLARKGGHTILVDNVPNHDIAITLGPGVCSALAGDGPLFPGEFSAFTRNVLEWAREAGHQDPADLAYRATAAIEAACERRLYSDDRFKGLGFLELLRPQRALQ